MGRTVYFPYNEWMIFMVWCLETNGPSRYVLGGANDIFSGGVSGCLARTIHGTFGWLYDKCR